jgi:ABC-type sugar transport system ATPase subunit
MDLAAEPEDKQPLIAARGLVKSFGAVRALRGVSLDIHRSQVHGLVGANGAGKSTFVHILSGVVTPDEGRVIVEGTPTEIAGPRAAADLGFSFIYQELALVPEFSAYENMTVKMRAKTPFGIADRGRRRAAARAAAARLGLRIDLEKPIRELSIAERGLVAIGRALVGEARFVFMDEPTASLSDNECERLFAVVRELTASGVAVAYVSHRLDEIEALCDVVTVFKDGEVVDRAVRGAYGRADLIRGITGSVAAHVPQAAAQPAAAMPRLEVANLSRPPRVKDVSFKLLPGEILGLGGLMGSGRTEVARLIYGVDEPRSGNMLADGQPYHPRRPRDAIGKGIVLVPEERRSQALVMDESVAFNINLGNWRAVRLRGWLPILDDGRARKRSTEIATTLSIKAKAVTEAVRTLSGGNQQKVVFARWLLREPRIMLLDEPTRGVDIGARGQIWKTVEDYAAAGGSAIVISSDLDELVVCHRVVVLVEGRSVTEVRAPEISEERLLAEIYSAKVVA